MPRDAIPSVCMGVNFLLFIAIADGIGLLLGKKCRRRIELDFSHPEPYMSENVLVDHSAVSDTEGRKMTVQFEHSPISAVRIGLNFNPPLLELRNEHVGMFWNRIRDQFPVARQKAPLGDSEGVDRLEGELFPTARYWFVAENEEIDHIELQRDKFALSWKRKDANNPKDPSFSDLLMPVFRKNHGIFEDFARNDVGIQDLSIGWCELNYKCVIKPCDYWRGTRDMEKVLPTKRMPETGRQGDAVEFSSCRYI